MDRILSKITADHKKSFNARRLIALFAALSALLCSCSSDIPADESQPSLPDIPEQQTQQDDISDENEKHELSLPYNDSDSLDPFLSKTRLNMWLAPLMYDGLFELDGKMTPVPSLCESYYVSANGLVWTFVLGEHLFSDGSRLTAADAEWSLKRCILYSSFWSSRLSNVKKIASQNAETLVLTLSVPDSGLPALLTMPIAKASPDSSAEMPLGTGRYVLSKDDEGELFLTPSSVRSPSDTPSENIRLSRLKKADQVIYSMAAGSVSAVSREPLSDSSVDFRVTYESVSYPTLSMQFIGVNCLDGLLSEPSFRRAVASVAAGAEIAGEGPYGAYFDPSPLPVHPSSYLFPKNIEMPATSFSDIPGLSDDDGDGYMEYNVRRTSQKTVRETVALSILVNSENSKKVECASLIASELSKAGIMTSVESVTFETFTSRIAAGDFTLCLAETTMRPDFGLSAFLDAKGTMNLGKWTPSAVSDEAPSLLDLSNTFSAASQNERAQAYASLAQAFLIEMPFIPLGFERGALIFAKSAPKNVQAFSWDIYHNIDKWAN